MEKQTFLGEELTREEMERRFQKALSDLEEKSEDSDQYKFALDDYFEFLSPVKGLSQLFPGLDNEVRNWIRSGNGRLTRRSGALVSKLSGENTATDGGGYFTALRERLGPMHERLEKEGGVLRNGPRQIWSFKLDEARTEELLAASQHRPFTCSVNEPIRTECEFRIAQIVPVGVDQGIAREPGKKPSVSIRSRRRRRHVENWLKRDWKAAPSVEIAPDPDMDHSDPDVIAQITRMQCEFHVEGFQCWICGERNVALLLFTDIVPLSFRGLYVSHLQRSPCQHNWADLCDCCVVRWRAQQLMIQQELALVFDAPLEIPKVEIPWQYQQVKERFGSWKELDQQSKDLRKPPKHLEQDKMGVDHRLSMVEGALKSLMETDVVGTSKEKVSLIQDWLHDNRFATSRSCNWHEIQVLEEMDWDVGPLETIFRDHLRVLCQLHPNSCLPDSFSVVHSCVEESLNPEPTVSHGRAEAAGGERGTPRDILSRMRQRLSRTTPASSGTSVGRGICPAEMTPAPVASASLDTGQTTWREEGVVKVAPRSHGRGMAPVQKNT